MISLMEKLFQSGACSVARETQQEKVGESTEQSIPEAGKEEEHPVSPNQAIHSGDALGRRTTPSPREDTRTRKGYVQRLEGHLLMCPFEERLAVLPDRL